VRTVFMAVPGAVLILAGCQWNTASPSPRGRQQGEKPGAQANKVLMVKVTSSGDITADGQPVTLEQLSSQLTELKKSGGEVWYYRENPTGEPHANAMNVIKLVADNKLPVLLSAKPDFSDVLDDKGVSHPGAASDRGGR
jgi:biopolymer transport protein ExbD